MSARVPSENQIVLRRFCGDEVFSVREVSVYVSLPRDGEGGGILLNLEIRSRERIACTVPDDEQPLLDPTPTVEVWLPVPTLTASALVGTSVQVAESYNAERDAMNRLYYCEHERLWGVDASFVESAGDRCRVRLRASARDINHYGGDKPDTEVLVDAWCTVLPPGYA